MKLKTVLGAVLALGLAGSAMADVIDFVGAGADPGTISYAGGLNPLVGTNILINGVFGTGTLLNGTGTVFPVLTGRLDFTTCIFLTYIPAIKLYEFGGGGTLTITGSGPGASSGTLLSGSVISAEYQAGTYKVALAAGDDTKNTELLTFFGEPTGLR